MGRTAAALRNDLHRDRLVFYKHRVIICTHLIGLLVLLVCLDNVGMAVAKPALEAIPDHINGAGLGKGDIITPMYLCYRLFYGSMLQSCLDMHLSSVGCTARTVFH